MYTALKTEVGVKLICQAVNLAHAHSLTHNIDECSVIRVVRDGAFKDACVCVTAKGRLRRDEVTAGIFQDAEECHTSVTPLHLSILCLSSVL